MTILFIASLHVNTAQDINFFYYIQRPAQTQFCVTVSIASNDVRIQDDYVVKLILQKLYIYFYNNNKNLINNQYKIHQ